MTGTKQSGYLKLAYASLTEDLPPLIEIAREEADQILATDPGLLAPPPLAVIREVLRFAPPFTAEGSEA